ncbi:MAG: hypothetical protein KDA21_08120 [Phycisphaerales bacterium]|nr:hypothetical protein [Phycisphaerales bacterium]
MRTLQWTGCGVLCLVLVSSAAGAGGAAPTCPGDADGDLQVNFDDLNLVLEHWNTTDPAGDVTGDGVVDFNDLNEVLEWWTDCSFDYGATYADDEAWQIGLEMLGGTGPLLLPQATYDRIDRDLDLIRVFEGTLASQPHTPAWSPSSLLVGLVDGADRTRYDAFNAYYGVINEQELFAFGGITYYLVTLPGRVNVVCLGGIYQQLAEVSSAEPDGIIGGQNFYTPSLLLSGNWRWDIDDGFWDCFDGCDCHYVWAFETDDAGNVTLIDATQFGQPWCPWPR